MFGWLRKRKLREHAKLHIQTLYACDVLAEGWYASEEDLSQSLKRRAYIVAGLADAFDPQSGFEHDAVEYLLSLNMELRRLHDAGPVLVGEGFDKAYEPLGGYSDAIDRFIEDR